MRKILITGLFVLAVILRLTAQNVAINESGNTPDTHAILDVNADVNADKGVLLPRMATADRNNLSSSLSNTQAGLTVYDTDTQSYWWWDGSQWTEVSKNGTCWSLTGNAGTAQGTNFLGTTDNQGLLFKTNNQDRMLLTDNGELQLYPMDGNNEGGELRFLGAGSNKYFYIDNNAGNMRIITQDASGESTKITATNSGNVGIGVTSPSAKLDVGGTSEFNGTMNLTNHDIRKVNSLYINDPGTNEGILWSGSSAKIFVSPLNGGNSDGYLRLINDGGIVFEAGSQNTESMIITSDDKVGIGTTNPAELLSVGSSSQFQVNSSGDIVKIKNLTYSWPTSYGEPNSQLMNDGNGNLQWIKSGWTALHVIDLNNVTSYTVTGLNGNEEVNYKIVLMGQQSTSDGNYAVCKVRPNGDANTSNYSYGMDVWWRYIQGSGYAKSYDTYNVSGILLYVADGNFNPNYVEIETILSAFTGNRRHAVTRYSLQGNSKDIVVNHSAAVWKNSTDNITSLEFDWDQPFTGKLLLYATH